MHPRPLGRSGITVAPLALGGNVFGWTIDEPTSFAVLDAFVDAGFNLIDTADIYSAWKPGNHGGESETILGRWFRRSGKRDRVVLATKLGKPMGPGQEGLSRAYIFQAVEESLRRLQTDRIDLYQAHADDPATPVEETLAAFAELVKQGKVRAIGASNFGPQRLAESLRASEKHGYPRYESLQPLYNLYSRTEYEAALESVCTANGLGVLPYYSLASGFLTGKYRSEADLGRSVRGAGIRRYLNARGFRILKALDRVARRFHATPGKVAIAWLLSRRSLTAPIASATRVEHVRDLIAATELRLDAAALAHLNQASA